MRRLATVLLVSLGTTPLAHGLPRDPAVSRTHIAFVEAGQIWVVPRGGSVATALTEGPGNKFTPRFSPDGHTVAFGLNEAQGQINLHTVPRTGGTPSRITFFTSHQVLGQWTADGRLLFYTNALSFSPIEMQLFTVSPAGGLPVRLPPAYGSDGAIDSTGEWLAYTPQWPNQLISSWKRYRGGSAPDLWLYNLRTRESRRITDWEGSDLRPMWDGAVLYYLSDQGAEGRRNLWAYDTRLNTRRQVTHFRDLDVRNPSIGPGAIVFERGGDLHLYDLRTGTSSRLRITIPSKAVTSVRDVDASRFITNRQPATGGRRVLFEARGDLWLAEPGGSTPRNLTSTSGVFEREASWSPDGRTIAYWSDAVGEYQLYLRPVDGRATGPLTRLTSGFRTRPVWSPDSRRLAFVDQGGVISTFDVRERRLARADAEPWAEPTELAWAADGTWLAYTRTGVNRLTAIWRYDVATRTSHQLSADAYNATTPVFDPRGERMFFVSYRNFANPLSDWIQQRIAHRATAVVMSVPLRGGLDAASFEGRAERVALSPGAVTSLASTHDGNPIVGMLDLAGATSIRVFDLAARRERRIIDGTSDFGISADGGHLLFDRDGKPMLRSLADSSETTIPTSLTARVDVRAEWRQIFQDTWRFYRDYFYAPKIGLADWSGVKTRYAPVLERCTNRDEVNTVLSEMIGESSVGHAYVAARGDVPSPPAGSPTAMLGADLELENGAFRITRILEAAPWEDGARSPLAQARLGEYVLAVNGQPLDPAMDPRAALAGLAGKDVTLTVAPRPTRDGAREITVRPLARENDLRRRAWIERNRALVDSISGGRIGYAHIPDFNVTGVNEFVRQYYGQIHKDALIIDTRWSTGGWTGGIVAELLDRPPLNHAAGRYSDEVWPVPRWGAHFGAKALLVNHITVSAGENFAYYFRKRGLGPIVGSRTWGGLTGLNPVPALIDGGAVNVPNAPFYDENGWLIEGRGIEPDVPVTYDPGESGDPQLEAAVRVMLEAISKPYRAAVKPK